MRPEDAQFGVKIDFVPGQSNPVQIFAAMADLLRGFVELDRQLIAAVLPDASPQTVIEGIEAASITAWIRSALNKADDKAIESMDVKKAIGVYLVKAKYKIIEFLDDRDHRENARRKTQLLADLTELAGGMPTSILFPTSIDLPALERPMNDIQNGKARLQGGETLTLRGEGQPDLKVDTDSIGTVGFSEPVKTAVTNDGGSAQMILLIRKPDLIGKAKWEFKHGRQTVTATISDAHWIARFHRGEEGSITPGSEMRARVHMTYQRDDAGSIAGVDYEVVEVLGILPPTASMQEALFSEDIR